MVGENKAFHCSPNRPVRPSEKEKMLYGMEHTPVKLNKLIQDWAIDPRKCLMENTMFPYITRYLAVKKLFKVQYLKVKG